MCAGVSVELKHILFPVDFSEPCTAATDYVQVMVRNTGARLTLLHVLEQPPSWYGDIEAARLSSIVDLAPVREHRQEQLNRYREDRLEHLAPLRVLLQGDAATEIVEYARREDVSLIMMPTRGLGVFRRSLLGSVTAKVLHDASCPVWTTSHSEHVTTAQYPYRVIICGIDFSGSSVETLRWASLFASEQHAQIRVVHAIDVDEHSTNRGIVEVRRHLREIALDEWRRLKHDQRLIVPLCIAYGSAGNGLRKAAHDLGADLVIIGRGHIQEPLGRLRSNSYAIVRESPCPVISVDYHPTNTRG
jgi:nucleotide-binding universal stress UspA family protein